MPTEKGAEAEPAVRVESADHVATVTIDRPPVNAVDPATLGALTDAFRALGEDRDVRVAVLTGAGTRAFVGGADLRASDGDRSEGPPGPQLDRPRLGLDAGGRQLTRRAPCRRFFRGSTTSR